MLKPIKLYLPPGIGDCLWPLQKLFASTDREFIVNTWERPTVSSHFLNGLERIVSVSQFKEPYKNYVDYKNFCYREYKQKYSTMNIDQLMSEKVLYLEANDFLEKGNRLETYLPNLSTQYKMPWKTDPRHDNLINELTENKNTILLYTSSVKNNKMRAMTGDWTFSNWVELISEIFKSIPGINVIWIGSSYDVCGKEELKRHFHNEKIEYFTDMPPEFIVALMKKVNCFLSYQSGISCISIAEDVPTCMFYYKTLQGLPKAICPPTSINNEKIYKVVFFDEIPDQTKKLTNSNIIEWVEQHLVF